MRRAVLAGVVASAAFAAGALAQLVPLTTCHAALPCSIPYGLRPADSVQNLAHANGGPGNTALTVQSGVGDLKFSLVKPVSEDPAESAARIFVRKNPSLLKPTPKPTPRVP
jgi:hypothetical protein